MYIATFEMSLPMKPVDGLITGYFGISSRKDPGMSTARSETPRTSIGMSVPASSGQPGHQIMWSYWTTGLCPIPSGSKYKIDLRWWEPGNKRAMGDRYYHITPDPIVGPHGEQRTEIGLHLDANHSQSPGSAGCIVICHLPDWMMLKKRLDEIARTTRKIPLMVMYVPRKEK